eukprot:31102-Pelagococcus_subviridis.AAC.8
MSELAHAAAASLNSSATSRASTFTRVVASATSFSRIAPPNFPANLSGCHRSISVRNIFERMSGIGVHHADGVVWGPVYRTRLPRLRRARGAPRQRRAQRALRRDRVAGQHPRADRPRNVGQPQVDRAAVDHRRGAAPSLAVGGGGGGGGVSGRLLAPLRVLSPRVVQHALRLRVSRARRVRVRPRDVLPRASRVSV